jgi:hypothetical protein
MIPFYQYMSVDNADIWVNKIESKIFYFYVGLKIQPDHRLEYTQNKFDFTTNWFAAIFYRFNW